LYYNHCAIRIITRHSDNGGLSAHTDFTLSYSLLDLGELPARAQISVLTNSNGGDHQIFVRQGDQDGNLVGQACTYRLKAAEIDTVVNDIRRILREKVASPTGKRCSKQDLQDNLRALAPLGRLLWTLTVGQCVREVYGALKLAGNGVVQVARPTTADYTFPWGLIYDIPLSEEPEKWKFCSLVDEWDDQEIQKLLVEPGTRRCPRVENGVHPRDTLCPYGFWGYLHDIEQLSATDTPIRRIPDPAGFEMAAALTQSDTEAVECPYQGYRRRSEITLSHRQTAAHKDQPAVGTSWGKTCPLFTSSATVRTTAPTIGHLSEHWQQEKIAPAISSIGCRSGWSMRPPRVGQDPPLIFINACPPWRSITRRWSPI
jgi:hypothetical protein